MIRINLLPAELESAPSARINPAFPLSAAAILPALLLIPFHMSQMATRRRLQTETASLKSELERYQPIIAQVDALEAAKVQLTQRKSVIQQLESERLRYPQFMDDFVKLIPNNVWLTNLVTASPANNNVMTISMDVVALDNYAIADLIANLETSQIFSEVDLGAISAAQATTGQTMSFHVTTNYKKAEPVADALKNHNLIIGGLAVLLFGIVCYSYWSLVYTPVSKAITSERTMVQDLNQKLVVAKSRASQLSKIQAEMAALQIDVAELEKLLPKTRELPSLIRVFTHRAEANGLTLTSFRPSRPVPKGLYDEVPYDIAVTSSLHGIGHFLTSMGKGERLFAARNLALTSIASKTDPSKTVNATFTLVAFKYHE